MRFVIKMCFLYTNMFFKYKKCVLTSPRRRRDVAAKILNAAMSSCNRHAPLMGSVHLLCIAIQDVPLIQQCVTRLFVSMSPMIATYYYKTGRI